MPADTQLSSRLVGAIERVRLQKQRPTLDRIHRVLRQTDPDLSLSSVGMELEKAAKDGIILKVITNDICSYKVIPATTTTATSRLPILRVLPNGEFLDAVVSVVKGLDRCSLEVLGHQLKRKYSLEIGRDSNLRQELRDSCRKLIKSGRLRKDGTLVCVPQCERDRTDPVGDEPMWKSATVRLEDCISSMVISSRPFSSVASSHVEKSRERFTYPSTEDTQLNTMSSASDDEHFDTTTASSIGKLPENDPYSFHLDPVLDAPVKHGKKKSSLSRNADVVPSVDKEVSQPLLLPDPGRANLRKTTGNLFADFAKMSSLTRLESRKESSSVANSVGKKDSGSKFKKVSRHSRELTTCDSTTNNQEKGSPPPSKKLHKLESPPSSSCSQQSTGDQWEETGDVRRSSSQGGSELDADGKPKKRSRSLQLAFLYDSLSKFFTATGEKRTAVQRSSQVTMTGQLNASNGTLRSQSRSERAALRPTRNIEDNAWRSDITREERSLPSGACKALSHHARKKKKVPTATLR